MYADGGCWSALGKAPGFEGHLKFGITLESLINGGVPGKNCFLFELFHLSFLFVIYFIKF